MSTPDFIVKLRKNIGHDPLWLIGITAFVRSADGSILLGRRSDTGEWALVYGINEPGEEPADTVIREVKEETGVDVVPKILACVKSSQTMLVYDNGDQTQYMDHLFICSLRDGGNAQPYVGDEESLSVGWFKPDALPTPLAQSTVERLAYVREYEEQAAQGDSSSLFATSLL